MKIGNMAKYIWRFSSFYARSGRVFPDRADVFHKKGKWQVAFHFTQLPKLCRPDSTRKEMEKCGNVEVERQRNREKVKV